MTSSKTLAEHYHLMFSENKAIMLLIDPEDGTVHDASLGACQFYGYSYADLTSKYIHDINTMDDAEVDAEMIRAKKESKNFFSFIHRLSSGEVCDVEVFSNTIALECKVYLFSVIHDVTDRIKAEEKIRVLASTDHLTGLYNRKRFDEQMTLSLALAERENKILAVMMLDLDEFKQINDTYGHPVGDAVLQAVADILTKFSRDTDVVARLGGDEFAILVTHPENEAGVGLGAQRIIDEIEKPLNIVDHEIQIGISIGIAMFPKDSDNKEKLVSKADLALYEVKKTARGTSIFYHGGMG